MAKYIFSIVSALLLIGFVSCDEERNATGGQGYLYLDIEKNVTMQTKAVNPVISVAILNAAEDTVKYIADFEKEQATEGVLLDAGAYDIVVSSGRKDSAAFELPYYYGEAACEIKTNQVTSTKVTCKIANTKVTVDYSDDFKKYFTDYSTTISNSSGSLTFEKGETRGGFFAPEKLLANLALTNKDGEHFQLKREYEDIQERYHYRLFFKLSGDPDNPDDSGEAGGKFDDITVDESADTVIVSIPIKVEDLDAMKAPVFELTGFDENNTLEYKEKKATESSLELTANNGIERLMLTIQSGSLNASFNLADLSENDKMQLNQIGFPIPETVKDTKELSFDFTEMSNMLAPSGGSPRTYTFALTVRDNKSQEMPVSFTYLVKPDVTLLTREIATGNIWTTFTFFTGEMEGEGELGFKYKKKTDTEWTLVSVESKNADGKTFTAFVGGLDARTEYAYKAVSRDVDGNEVEGNTVAFTTDFANADDNGKPFVPNLSFDNWYKENKSWYANESSSNLFWDSGNKGANTIGENNPTSPISDVAVAGEGKQAALLKTKKVFEILAAGNIYTGTFGKVEGLSGASLNFGQPYSGGRPTKLVGYYKYQPVAVSEGGHEELTKGVMDKCAIYIALCNWSSPFKVNTSSGTFVNLAGDDILAYGELSEGEASVTKMDNYARFEIDIKYKKETLNVMPTYILIVASASKYGDYFTGGEGSTLYIDEFELQYDYNPASFVGTSLEGLGK